MYSNREAGCQPETKAPSENLRDTAIGDPRRSQVLGGELRRQSSNLVGLSLAGHPCLWTPRVTQELPREKDKAFSLEQTG